MTPSRARRMRCASERCRWLVRHFVRVAARRCLEGEQRHSAWCGCGGADRQAHFGRYHAVLHFRRYNIVMSYNAVGAEERSGPLSAGNFFNSASVSSAFKGFITAWPVWSFYRGWDEYKEYASQVGTAKLIYKFKTKQTASSSIAKQTASSSRDPYLSSRTSTRSMPPR